MAHTLDGQGDRQTALKMYQRAVELFREIGDGWALTHPLCDLAWRTWDEGRLHEALALIQEHLAVFRRLRSSGAIAMALGYLTAMAITLGDFATAAQAAQEKAEMDLSGGLPLDKAYGLFSVGSVSFAQGDLAQARRQLESAHKIAREADDHGFTSDVLTLLAHLAVCEGTPDRAVALLEEGRRLGKEGESRPWLNAHILLGLGRAACSRNDFGLAARLFRESLQQIQVVRPEIPSRLEGLAQAFLGLGQAAQAATLLGAAHHLRVTMAAPILPVERPRYEATMAGLRAALSEEDHRQAWAGR